jgi:hypothetical protein
LDAFGAERERPKGAVFERQRSKDGKTATGYGVFDREAPLLSFAKMLHRILKASPTDQTISLDDFPV